jgi:hypothetical protein
MSQTMMVHNPPLAFEARLVLFVESISVAMPQAGKPVLIWCENLESYYLSTV